ncbi:MAG: Crp/Fnr family transcriptional regulator [Acetobacteraceae bacterium]|nr:Crp/Fnr family transcriptional regulator [Acetobacteraceae bacterium]
MPNVNRSDVINLLGRSQLFRELDRASLEIVFEAAAVRGAAPDAVLFRQGDPPSQLFVLTNGQVKVAQVNHGGAPLTIRFMEPGDVIGCVAVFRGVCYPATAIAIAPSTALAWPSSRIAELMEQFPQIGKNALNLVGSRAQEMLHRLREMATEPVNARVAAALLRLCRQAGRIEGKDTVLAVSRQDIAEMAGTNLYSVSRALSRWDEQGILEARRQLIKVRDKDRLRRLSAKQ